MRATDEKVPEEAKGRALRTWIGLVFAIGGIGYAFFYPEQAKLSFGVALVGAGVIDPTHLLRTFGK